jgi:IrrE N-terminal-like domain
VSLATPRLKELEEIALEATRLRHQLQQNPTARTFDISVAVGMMIRGRVRAVANLRHEGRRVSGLFVPSGAFPEVLFEAYEPRRRQRFTIAHELGHSYLDPAAPPVCDPAQVDQDPDSNEMLQDVRESEADAFGSAFLIPAVLLAADIGRFSNSVAYLADLYDVSEPTMRRRLRATRVESA